MAITYPTLANIVEATILRIGQVNGIGAQVYSEDVIAEMVIHKFDVLFDQFDFPQYCDWYTGTLGSDGKCDTDLQVDAIGIYRYKDLIGIWYENDELGLKQFPSGRVNAQRAATSTAHPKFVEATSDDRVFRVLPIGNAGDSLYIRYKKYPQEIIADTQLKVDRQALILGAAYDYLADDNANPAAIEKMRNMFNQRMTQLTNDTSVFDAHDPRAHTSQRHEESSGYIAL